MPIAVEDPVSGAEMVDDRGRRLMADPRRLRDRITDILNRNPIGLNPEGHYLPDGELEDLFTAEAVRSALGGNVDHTLTEFVLQRAPKTFATLLLVFSDCGSREKAMKAFRETSFSDEDLSFAVVQRTSAALELCDADPCRRGGGTCSHHFPLHNPWDLTDISHFKSKRWHFLVPTLDHNIFQYEINSQQLVPFTRNDLSAELNSGNFSDVECVKMLTSKQTKITSRDETIIVALKTLKRINEPRYDIDKEWRREAKAHKQLNDTRDHIVQAIAAYRQIANDRQNDAYHLVLEWADGGTLLSFWGKHPEPQVDGNIERSRKRIMLILKQLCGLADALEGMHTTSAAKSPEHSKCNSPEPSNSSPKRDGRREADNLDQLSLPPDELPVPAISLEEPTGSQEGKGGAPSLTLSLPGFSDESPLDAEPLVRRTSHVSSENWRHGDIKPENILRLTGGMDNAWIGTLKLADLGRAQQHMLKTLRRDTIEKEHWRTRWYEPPDLAVEMHEQAQGKISRLFDMWSLGCVVFETVLWLLHGFDSISRFQRGSNLTSDVQLATPYWTRISHARYEVSETASRWMNDILQHDPERDCAVGHLITLVKDRLLKVDLPPDSEIYTRGYRTNAADLKDQLERIIIRAETDEKYLFTGIDRANTTIPYTREPSSKLPSQPGFRSSLTPKAAETRSSLVVRGSATTIAQQRDYTNTIEDHWKVSDDDDFVKSKMRDCQLLPRPPDLCQACGEIDILSWQICFAVDNLKRNAEEEDCDLCELVYKAVEAFGIGKDQSVTLTRKAECFFLRGTEKKVLRLCRTDSEAKQDVRGVDIPLGAPVLSSTTDGDPSAETLDAFVKLPKAWLQECNTNHGDLCAPGHHGLRLPKRLVSVGNPKKPKIIEPEGQNMDPQTVDYIAFSHKWGNMLPAALTTKQNLEQRKKRIPLHELPLSFKNAIAITRALGRDYLWIDCLCISQGPDGDFAEQADTMQTTFNGAYCVISACTAENATDGFLKHREPRCVRIGGVFVSAVTDDFERDVLQSALNRRGWVLQERALARRTIFFTDNQMYWECGDGIRCETLAKLKNDETAFLGDPNFPNYTIRANRTRGAQIFLFTKLFQRYSTLEFSHFEDRPVAIDGLMDRLTKAFRTRSLAGLFESFWGRCLLWQRARGTTPLKKIPRGTHMQKNPPSWSWMAFEGAISFLEPWGGEVDWNEVGVELPFAHRTQSSWLKTSHLPDSNAIHSQAFDLAHVANSMMSEAYLSYDGGKALPTTMTKCVIVGSEQGHMKDPVERRHYIMLISNSTQTNGATSYERVGVGYLLGRFIDLANPVSVSIE